jgi:hypothetical protein
MILTKSAFLLSATARASTLTASSVSAPLSRIWSSGSRKPFFPVSRSSTPYEYRMLSERVRERAN